MILSEIRIPGMNMIVDARLCEEAKAAQVTAELLEALEGLLKEKASPEGFLLCDPARGRILPPELTLEQCGVRSGCTLLLL